MLIQCPQKLYSLFYMSAENNLIAKIRRLDRAWTTAIYV